MNFCFEKLKFINSFKQFIYKYIYVLIEIKNYKKIYINLYLIIINYNFKKIKNENYSVLKYFIEIV